MVERAAKKAEAVGDDDLFVLAGLARGRCLDVQGRKAQALAALDEIMVYVVGDRGGASGGRHRLLFGDLAMHGSVRHAACR